MKWSDRPEVVRGNMGEAIVDAILAAKNYRPYAPVGDGAHPFDRVFVRGDAGVVLLADVKTKPARTRHPDTGIDIRHYKKYMAVRAKLNVPMWLFFVDAETDGGGMCDQAGCIYAGEIQSISTERVITVAGGARRKYPSEYQGIIYFPLEAMHLVRPLTEQERVAIGAITTRSAKYQYGQTA
jgi:hypothetical protein